MPTAPYGRWKSAISAEAATAGTKTLTSPRSDAATGRAFYLQSQEDGTSTVVEIVDGTSTRQVLPSPWSVGTTVYSYGGTAYVVLEKTQPLSIVFQDAHSQSVNVLEVDSGAVTTLVEGQSAIVYADFSGSAAQSWILALQEDRTHPKAADVKNYVVAIHRKTGNVVRVVEGADFYSYAQWQPSSTPTSDSADQRLSWRQWNHPDLPFEGVTLHTALWHPDRGLSQEKQVAGHDNQSVGEYHWAPDGKQLVFSIERTESNYRQLFAVAAGEDGSTAKGLIPSDFEGEFGDASWFVGWQTFVFLSPTRIVAAYTLFGESRLVLIDLQDHSVTPLESGLAELRFDPLAALPTTNELIVVGSGYTSPTAVYRAKIEGGKFSKTLIARSTDQVFPESLFSTPQLVRVPTKTGETFGWYWPPHNADYQAPANTSPPLIINPHGGPTGYITPGLHMVAQFWATRGFAFFASNYSGSSGHGKAYRASLWEHWGILDRDDVADSVRYLTSSGKADPNRVGIEGASAGGYNVLQSLVGYPKLFAGGICCCGVADIKALAEDTHKLESHYLDRLLWTPGSSLSDAEKEKIQHDRSPLFHADQIVAPLLLIHGDKDPVVPIAQSEVIRDKILKQGGTVELVVLEGEGHSFAKAESLVRQLKAEEAWWDKTLLK